MNAVQRNPLERAIVAICSVVLWVTTVVIFVILTANTVLRYTGGTSLQWANELPELLFPWLVIAGVVLAAEKGAHIATVFLMEAVPPGVRRVVGVVGWLVVAGLYATLVEGDLQHVGDRARRDLADPARPRFGDLRLRDGRHGDAGAAGAAIGVAGLASAGPRRRRTPLTSCRSPTGNPAGENAMSALILLVFLGGAVAAIPIAHALLLAALAAAATSDRVPLDLLVQQMVAQVQSFPLIAIPFFMLTGALMMGGRLGEAIVGMLYVADRPLAWRAGAGQRAVVDLVRRRLRFGRRRCLGDRLAADPLAQASSATRWPSRPPRWPAAATIDILIPPSIPMILFALSANESIAALFVAGVLPGLLMCGGFMAACWWVGKRRNFPRETAPVDRAAFRRNLLFSAPAARAAGADHHLPALRHRHADRGRRVVHAVRGRRFGADLPRPARSSGCTQP